MNLPFYKYEGLKNDFVIIDLRNAQESVPLEEILAPKVHRKLCERHSGIGADGVLLLKKGTHEPSTGQMIVINADGTRPQMCGNGVRCIAQYLYDQAQVTLDTPFIIETDAGLKQMEIRSEGIRVDMGMAQPWVDGKGTRLWGQKLSWSPKINATEALRGWAVDMGNPHLVLRQKSDFQTIHALGPAWAKHPFFEEGVNVGFSELIGPQKLNLMVWERGSGATWACGTGACAAAVAWAHAEGWTGEVEVCLPGGALKIEVTEVESHMFQVFMTGPARHVYSGEFSLSD
jgi:diaminopimelate epimerase